MPPETTKGRGRPADYKPEFCQRAAELCIGGATDEEIAEVFDVSVRTVYRWLSKYPEFRQAMQLGKDAADERVVRSLYHRAVGYNHTAVKIVQNMGAPVVVPYTEHIPPDVGAITMWLTNRKRGEWKHHQSTELTGANDGPVPLEITVRFVRPEACNSDIQTSPPGDTLASHRT